MNSREIPFSVLLVTALLALVAGTACIAHSKKSETAAKKLVTLDLGFISSVTVPETWNLREVQNSDSRDFVKLRRDWWDCMITMKIGSPIKISSKDSEDLKKFSHHSKPTKQQIDFLKSLPVSNATSEDDDQTKATTCSIKDKRLLIVEHRGQMIGPCEPMSGGGRRRPLLKYVRGVAYALSPDAMTVQTIRFDADVMGDVKPCSDSIRAALNSIEWTN